MHSSFVPCSITTQPQVSLKLSQNELQKRLHNHRWSKLMGAAWRPVLRCRAFESHRGEFLFFRKLGSLKWHHRGVWGVNGVLLKPRQSIIGFESVGTVEATIRYTNFETQNIYSASRGCHKGACLSPARIFCGKACHNKSSIIISSFQLSQKLIQGGCPYTHPSIQPHRGWLPFGAIHGGHIHCESSCQSGVGVVGWGSIKNLLS